MARTTKKLVPDYANGDVLRGLPNNFVTVHSRYPSVPSLQSGAVSAHGEPTGDVAEIMTGLDGITASPEAVENWNTVLTEINTTRQK